MQRGALESCEDVAVGPRMEATKQRQDLVPDEAAGRVGVRGVSSEPNALGVAVRLGLFAPDGQQRANHPVVAAQSDPRRATTRDEAVQDRLDLVGRGVARRAQRVVCERVAELAELRLRQPSTGRLHDDGAERPGAEAGIALGFLSAQTMVDVQRRDPVAERRERVPEAGRVRAARDEAGHVAAGRDELVPADLAFDPCSEGGGLHAVIVAPRRAWPQPARTG